MDNTLKTANLLSGIARYGLASLGTTVFMFALISGSDAYGGGWEGIIKNSPNTLPWLTLIIFIIIAWKNEVIGGALVTIFGFGAIYFFNFSGPNFFPITFVLTVLITTMGGLFLISGYMRKSRKNSKV